jgi:ribonuclease HI
MVTTSYASKNLTFHKTSNFEKTTPTSQILPTFRSSQLTTGRQIHQKLLHSSISKNLSSHQILRTSLLPQASPHLLILDITINSKSVRVINVYNPPASSESRKEPSFHSPIDLLFSLQSQDIPTIWTGDFNLHNRLWNSKVTSQQVRAESINLVDWIQTNNWNLETEQDTITFKRQDSTLDLTFSNPALRENGIEVECFSTDLVSSSDHYATSITLFSQVPLLSSSKPKNYRKTDWKAVEEILATSNTQLNSDLSQIQQIHQREEMIPFLEDFTSRFSNLISSTIDEATPFLPPPRNGRRLGLDREFKQIRRERKAIRDEMRRSSSPATEFRPRMKVVNRKLHQRLINSEKRSLSFLETVSGPKETFAALKRLRSNPTMPSPDLQSSNGTIISNQEEKRELIFQTLLPPPPPSQSEDLALPSRDAPDFLDQQPPLTREEARKALFSGDINKSPGEDGISYLALRLVWKSLEEPLFNLLSLLLQVGLHPQVFKSAILQVVPKKGKDPALPKSYRPIAMQPCLGKVLEKIVASRLAHLATSRNLIPPEQFGGLPNRNATDAVQTLVHDIEGGWLSSDIKTTSLVTVDIKGAFDHIEKGKLIKRLQELQLPPPLILWTHSFLTGRTAAIKLDGQKGDQQSVPTGSPQGSPVSPILFLLLTSSLLSCLTTEAAPPSSTEASVRVIAYMDDFGIYCSSPTSTKDKKIGRRAATKNVEVLERCLARFRDHAASLGFGLDPAKTELMHFPSPGSTAARWKESPEDQEEQNYPSLKLSDTEVITPHDPHSPLKYLGTFLDTRLSFEYHVEQMCIKAMGAINSLRPLNSSKRGLSAASSRLLYLTAVLPILLYGSSIWWRGFERVETNRAGEKEIQRIPGAGKKLKELEKVHYAGLKFVLPCWRTTSRESLEKMSSIPPIEVILSQINKTESLRIASLPLSHPLQVRALSSIKTANWVKDNLHGATIPPSIIVTDNKWGRWGRPRMQTRLQDLSKLFTPRPQPTIPSLRAPWEEALANSPQIHKGEVGTSRSTTIAKKHSQEARKLQKSGRHLLVYSDGSRKELKRDEGLLPGRQPSEGRIGVGAGWSVWYEGKQVKFGSCSLGSRAEVFDAEAVALARGLEAAIEFASSRPAVKHIHLFADNSSVIKLAFTTPSSSSQQSFIDLEAAARSWIAHSQHQISLGWVPGHTKIAGNEKADSLAKLGAASPPKANSLHPTKAHCRRQIRERREQEWKEKWIESTGPTIARVDSYRFITSSLPTSKPSPEQYWRRKDLLKLVQARTGHGDFAAYHRRFQHQDAVLLCRQCSNETSRSHPFFCPALEIQQNQLLVSKEGFPLTVRQILDSPDGSSAFLRFISSTSAFQPYTPTDSSLLES